jgi:anti-anti-sigma regulatory factor
MLKTRIERSGETGSLVLEGEMIIDHAEELKTILLEALKNGGSLGIAMEHVNKVDLFGLQVLCSAHRFAIKEGKALMLIGERSEALRDAIVTAGFGRTAACSAHITCPWNEE